MPDDSSPDFRASQQKHADEIRTARVISQKTGLPFNQVRQRLKEFADRGQAAQSEAVRQGGTPQVANIQYGPRQGMGFEPRPFAGPEFTGKGGGTLIGTQLVENVTYVVVDPGGPTVTMYEGATFVVTDPGTPV